MNAAPTTISTIRIDPEYLSIIRKALDAYKMTPDYAETEFRDFDVLAIEELLSGKHGVSVFVRNNDINQSFAHHFVNHTTTHLVGECRLFEGEGTETGVHDASHFCDAYGYDDEDVRSIMALEVGDSQHFPECIIHRVR